MNQLRRIFAVVAALAGGILALASATAAPAFAMRVPPPGERGSGTGPPVLVTPVHVIAGGGMPGWQITLIAVGAALVAAVAAVLLDRVWAARKAHAPAV
jgi:hypothetical protein